MKRACLSSGSSGRPRRSAFDVVLGELERQQVGIREVAIVVRLLLGAHRARLARHWIEQPRLLLDRAAVLEDLDLAARLVSIAWPMKRIELTFLISQRVPSGSPGRRTDTLTSARRLPFSMSPSQVPR